MSTSDVNTHRAAMDAERLNNALDQLCVNTIRTLAMDAVQQAETFGASAPLAELQKKFGFTPEHIVEAATQQIARVK